MSDPTKVEERGASRYRLELVAQVAATLVTGRMTGGRLERERCREAAWAAVDLLDACAQRLEEDEVIRQRGEEYAGRLNTEQEEREQLAKKFPEGVPWVVGLRKITGRKSEADALPIFKKWTLYYLEHYSSNIVPPGRGGLPLVDTKVNDEAVGREVARLRREGFLPAEIPDTRLLYNVWHREEYLPAVRQKIGRTGGRKKMKK